MPPDDAAAVAAQQDIPPVPAGGPAPLGMPIEGMPFRSVPAGGPAPVGIPIEGMPLGFDRSRHPGPVVAGPPDDALTPARLEILAALCGAPTPGGV